MNTSSELNRREFLDLSVKLALALPFAPMLGPVQAAEFPLSPKDSLKKLILVLGPWSATEKQRAEDFASRFLRAEHAVEPYLPGSGELVQSLASRFPADTMAIGKINLQDLPPEERGLLVKLTKQLYGFVEVRFNAADIPPWGLCQGDRLLHTRPPV